MPGAGAPTSVRVERGAAADDRRVRGPAVVSAFRFSTRGTKFTIFAQAPETGFASEVVRVRTRPGSIGAGPRDTAMHVIDARRKLPYRRDADASLRARPP